MKDDGPTDSHESVSNPMQLTPEMLAPLDPEDVALLTGKPLEQVLAEAEAAGVQAVRKVDPESVERAIDFMEELGIPLVPWQAMAFRAIMLWDGKIEVMTPRQHPQHAPTNPFWGGSKTPLQTPPWGGLEA